MDNDIDSPQRENSQDAPLSVGAVAQLLRVILAEQRRVRRTAFFMRLLFLVVLLSMFGALITALGEGFSDSGLVDRGGDQEGHAAVVHLHGVMFDGTVASAAEVARGLREAFDNRDTLAVLLAINSPGGSPVQAEELYEEILRLRRLHPDTPLYAVISDTGASAAYYVAAAANQIYAARASLVGSIGVMYSGFGLTDSLDKLGIERRLIVAGDQKGFLDPFSPLNEVAHSQMQAMLDTIHQQFISRVRAGRGDRLVDGDQLFSGLAWTGEQALELGLIDGLGSVRSVARDVVKTESVVDFTVQEEWPDRLFRDFTSSLAHSLAGYFSELR